jgi:hypothetical protein
MKGFKIYYRQETIKAAVSEGMITFNLFNDKQNSRLYIGAIDYAENRRIEWHDFSEIEIGDKFEIEVSEIDTPSTPAKIVEDMKIERPKNKLEIFRELENKLKQKGLL